MSSPDPNPEPDRSLPKGIPAPPPPRPPDLKDPRNSGPTYGDKDSKKKKKRGERTHPTDPYPKLKKRRGCCACLGGLFVVAVLAVVGLVVAVGYFTSGRFIADDYEVVRLTEANAVVDTAPSAKTVYLCQGTLAWDVPLTRVPVAIVAREVSVAGDFHESVSISAIKVSATERARFAKDLEIFAGEFKDGGITLKGTLKGRVIKNVR